jgi:bacterioferritin-associated ferredoxin
MVICHCLAMNDRTITELAGNRAITVDDVVAACGAGGECGGCRDSIELLLTEARSAAAAVRVGSAP